MIRDVDLVSYLPAFLARYEELEATLEAENPEFVLVWEAANRALLNSFISTADEYGISRFESLLGILPSLSNDTLESRRTRVQALWWNELPYTIRQLAAKLAEICGDDGYEIDSSQLTEYAIGITVHLYQYGEIDTLRSLVMGMIPANMVIRVLNEIVSELEEIVLVCVASAIGTYTSSVLQEARNKEYDDTTTLYSGSTTTVYCNTIIQDVLVSEEIIGTTTIKSASAIGTYTSSVLQ